VEKTKTRASAFAKGDARNLVFYQKKPIGFYAIKPKHRVCVTCGKPGARILCKRPSLRPSFAVPAWIHPACLAEVNRAVMGPARPA
jgi:hypothetical protein